MKESSFSFLLQAPTALLFIISVFVCLVNFYRKFLADKDCQAIDGLL